MLTLAHPERLQVELEWTRVSANAMYLVQRMRTVTPDGTDGAEAWKNLGAQQSGNTYTDTTVTYGTVSGTTKVVYSYRVQAIENGIQGDPSAVKTATIPQTTPSRPCRPPCPRRPSLRAEST